MTFEQIFDQDGLYRADGFAEGFAFKIDKGQLSYVDYETVDTLLPHEGRVAVYKNLFRKDYVHVLLLKELF